MCLKKYKNDFSPLSAKPPRPQAILAKLYLAKCNETIHKVNIAVNGCLRRLHIELNGFLSKNKKENGSDNSNGMERNIFFYRK